MNARKHAALARALVDACGGLIEAAEACRISKSALGNATSPEYEYFLPVDAVVDLERYCGKPLYSRALLDAAPVGQGDGDIVGEAIDLTMQAASLNAHLHQALRDGHLSGREKNELQGVSTQLRAALNTFDVELEDVK